MVSSSTSSSSGVAAAEDAIQALMDYLVAPMLPSVSSGPDLPSISLQESVAKQVHAVVLLYNYYYRKEQPQAENLHFKSFCQLAVIVKPTLISHMKLMHHADFAELEDMENQLSLTEKTIMKACDISSALNPSKNTPNTENWDVSKVAVLLTDSSKNNILLQFSSITQGVWSLIEKDLPGAKSKGEEGKHNNKRKRNSKKNQGGGDNTNEADFRQLAFSAVNETTGISQGDLVVLESHTVYSLSKEKSAVQFYIVQCSQAIDEERRLPTKDIIESLRGPLLRKRNYSWSVTPVVEYFHLLPYAEIVDKWFSRELILNSPQGSKMAMEKVDIKSPQKVGSSIGNKNIDDSLRNTNFLDSVEIQFPGTDRTKYLQKTDSGTKRVELKDVNNDNSQMTDTIPIKENKQEKIKCFKIDNSSNFVANGCNKVLTEKNGDADCSMVYCLGGGEIGNSDVKSCHKLVIDNLFDEEVSKDKLMCGKKTNATDSSANKMSGINTESSKMVIINGNDASDLLDCHTDGSFKIDELCKYKGKQNGKPNTESNENKQNGENIKFSEQISSDKIDSSGLPDCQTGHQKMDIDESSKIQLENGNNERNGCTILKVYRHKKRASSSNSRANGSTDGVKVKVEIVDSMSNSCVPKFENGKIEKGNDTLRLMCVKAEATNSIPVSDQNGLVIGDQAIVPYQLNSEYQNNNQITQTSKDNGLSQAALKFLLRKKSKLADQLRNLEDEISVCDKTIQTILDGGENELALKVEAILDSCYDVSLKGEAETQELACQRYGTQVSPQLTRKTLLDAVIPSQNSCQELDNICHSNCWTLPTYQLYPTNGGLWASIKLKGTDFEYSEDSELCLKPRLARESAARKMIAKLQCRWPEPLNVPSSANKRAGVKTHVFT